MKPSRRGEDHGPKISFDRSVVVKPVPASVALGQSGNQFQFRCCPDGFNLKARCHQGCEVGSGG